MALIGNGFRENTLGKMFGGTSLNGANPSVHEFYWHQAARMRNALAGEGITDSKASFPSGARHPVAWVMPRKAGALSSRYEAVMTIAGSGTGAMGLPTEGTSSISFTVADAAGELISSGGGSASMSFTFANALLTASLGGVGSSSFTISTNTPLLGAQTSGIGSASFVITGSMTPYAIGTMTGSTLNGGALTEASIIAAMNASPPAVNIKKVNDIIINGVGTLGNPWGP